MASVNKVILLGNLGRDPEIRYTQNGTAVCQLNMATTRVYTNKNNERTEETEWHRVVVWGKQAEHCNQYLTKGRQAYIEGRLQTRSYEDKDGQKRYSTEIVADNVLFIGSGAGAGSGRGAQDGDMPSGRASSGGGYGSNRSGGSGGSAPGPGGSADDFGLPNSFGDDDIPF